jgi:hypothetical protein
MTTTVTVPVTSSSPSHLTRHMNLKGCHGRSPAVRLSSTSRNLVTWRSWCPSRESQSIQLQVKLLKVFSLAGSQLEACSQASQDPRPYLRLSHSRGRIKLPTLPDIALRLTTPSRLLQSAPWAAHNATESVPAGAADSGGGGDLKGASDLGMDSPAVPVLLWLHHD